MAKMSDVPATIPTIVCLVCREKMRVHHHEFARRTESLIVAVECRCGREIESIRLLDIATGAVLSSRDLNPRELGHDEVAREARDDIEHLKQRIAAHEKWIAAATWVRERPRSESAS
jgi:hypothetical protein